MVRVQQHIAFIQQQYDSHLEPLRKDQLELISFWSELREMLNRNEAQLKALRDDEVWTITNIANTIAERSERIDSLNRRIQRSDDEVAKARWTETVSSMKQWIGSLHAVIERLQSISNRKAEEVDRLKSSMASIWSDVRKLMASSHRAHRQVIGRLFELQNHYGLPAVMETVNDVEGQCHAVTSSLKVVLSKTDCSDYFERALSLHQSARILSQRGTKMFFRRFIELLSGVVVDSMVIHEYIETNKYRKNEIIEEEQDEIDDKDHKERVPNLNDSQRSSGHVVAASTDQIVSHIFMPIGLSPSAHSGSYGLEEVIESEPHKVTRHQLLHYVLYQNEFGLKFQSIDFLQTLSLDPEMELLKRIETVSIFAHLVPYRESVFLSVAQFVCIEHWQHILSLNGDKLKIAKFAESQVVLLLNHVLSTRSKANGLIRRIKRIQRHQRRRGRPLHAERGGKVRGVNMHKMAALILHDVYKIDSPFPM